MKYAWITDQAKDYPVTILCRFMDVSVVAIMIGLALLKRIEKENEALTEQLKNCLKTVARLMEPVVLKRKLAEKGVHISRRRIGRLMKKPVCFVKRRDALKRRLIPSIISVYLKFTGKRVYCLNLIATMWVILPILPPRKAGYI
nr:hypothetical protein [sulfur-oxidizing endosymbiont of Gigantopelta aegis]